MSDNSFSAADKLTEQPRQIDQSFSTQISSAALVNVLIRKGVISASELLEEERRVRAESRTDHQPVKNEHSHRHSSLKRWASKRRWSRLLTRFLFGWEFKRVRIEHSTRKSSSAGE